MVDVNWDGTEKVIDQSCHIVTLTNDVIQKTISFKNNNVYSPKQKQYAKF